MPQKTLEPVFTRRGFLLFVFVAPTAILVLLTILVVAQYRQLQRVVSSHEAVPAFAWDAASEARKDSLLSALDAFAAPAGDTAHLTAGDTNSLAAPPPLPGPDSLLLSDRDLTILASASPAARAQKLHMRVTSRASRDGLLLFIETTQSIEDQNRRFSWVFKKLIPHEYRFLNAGLEGVPEWKHGRLTFLPQRGFMNGGKVSRKAIAKRAELSPKAYLDSAHVPAYERLLARVDTVVLVPGGVALVRAR
jgi:hypothetical protein